MRTRTRTRTRTKQRLSKILSRAGIASRRAAESLIREGRVEVDGVVVSELGTLVDAGEQDVRVDGARVRTARPRRYLALHKPRGYVTTKSDPGRRPTVMQLLPPRYQTLNPVGRLDMATSGLLLLTDDGELAQELTHPRYGVSKTYLVVVLGTPSERSLSRAVRGVMVDGERLRLDDVRVLGVKGPRPERRASEASPGARARGGGAPRALREGQGARQSKLLTRLRVTLRQGKYREVRRVFRALGHPVVELHRERIGSLSMRGLPPGAFRPLTPEEIGRLRDRVVRAPGSSRKKPKKKGRRRG